MPVTWDVMGPGDTELREDKGGEGDGGLQGPPAVGWESGPVWEILGRGHSAGRSLAHRGVRPVQRTKGNIWWTFMRPVSSELMKWAGEGCVCLEQTGLRVWGLTRVEGTLTCVWGLTRSRRP